MADNVPTGAHEQWEPPAGHHPALKYRPLGRTGMQVSSLGFGAGPLGGLYGELDLKETARCVHEAIELGLNFFDTAPYYGHTLSEERLGEFLKGRRKRVHLATKCARYREDAFDFSADRIRSSIDDSLRRLRTDYLDLYQIHDVEFGSRSQLLGEAIPALLEVKRSGKARAVGITGLPLRFLRGLAQEVPIDTVLSYCHHNLLVEDLLDQLDHLSSARGIGLINASPLHMGILAAAPPEWHPAPQVIKDLGARLHQLCEKKGHPLTQIALWYAIQDPRIATTIVGMKTPSELKSNLEGLMRSPREELLKDLNSLIAPHKNTTWAQGRPENS